ncbi:MAG: Peroxiredoxin [Acidimicrobiia bacterium]|nr:Peroxiredoxin [Acidimicrobiia bacterium]
MALTDIPLTNLQGKPTSLADHAGKALLIVNVASKCGLTPQYEGLQKLQDTYGPKGFTVLGFPCNQFGGQEPGTNEEISTFCDTNYNVSFPLFDKVDVNGPHQSPLFAELNKLTDADGHSGDIRWNFEKFVVSSEGEPVARFAPTTTPDDPALVATIEKSLPS